MRWFFEIGVEGMRMRDDYGTGYALYSDGGDYAFVDRDDIGLPGGFVPEYGSGNFASSIRLRSTFATDCLQAPVPSEDDWGVSPLVLPCNDTEPLQASYNSAVRFEPH